MDDRNKWFTCIIKNKQGNKIYIGSTNNLDRRISDHNRDNTRSTKHFVPWKLVYFEEYDSKRKALVRGRQLKG